jgi:hypothetical protein
MKCLSIKQPWASLIIAGIKTIENRSWRTNYRGKILIHTGKEVDIRAVEDSIIWQHILKATPNARGKFDKAGKLTGAILGVAELTACSCEADALSVDYRWAEPGFFWWRIENPVLFEKPIPYRGQLGLFDVPEEVVREQHIAP